MNEVISKPSEHPQKSATGISAFNALLGLWLIISTFVLAAFNNLQGARLNNIIVGILVGLFSIMRASGDQRACWSWSNVVLGVWLIISPFALGFSNIAAAVWHNVIVGILVGVLGWSRAMMPSSHPAHAA